jgi:hypothetical protein
VILNANPKQKKILKRKKYENEWNCLTAVANVESVEVIGQ